jgi:hypothetical protein
LIISDTLPGWGFYATHCIPKRGWQNVEPGIAGAAGCLKLNIMHFLSVGFCSFLSSLVYSKCGDEQEQIGGGMDQEGTPDAVRF